MQLAGENKGGILGRAILFQICPVEISPFTDGAVFLRQLQVRHIVIAYKDVVDTVFMDSGL